MRVVDGGIGLWREEMVVIGYGVPSETGAPPADDQEALARAMGVLTQLPDESWMIPTEQLPDGTMMGILDILDKAFRHFDEELGGVDLSTIPQGQWTPEQFELSVARNTAGRLATAFLGQSEVILYGSD